MFILVTVMSAQNRLHSNCSHLSHNKTFIQVCLFYRISEKRGQNLEKTLSSPTPKVPVPYRALLQVETPPDTRALRFLLG